MGCLAFQREATHLLWGGGEKGHLFLQTRNGVTTIRTQVGDTLSQNGLVELRIKLGAGAARLCAREYTIQGVQIKRKSPIAPRAMIVEISSEIQLFSRSTPPAR